MASTSRRRIIQLRPDMAAGSEAMGTATSMKSGWRWAHTQVCMPPMELPMMARTWRTPRCSVNRRYCACTMSS
ncbi:hypothetical protein D3C72_2256960 [compost metagenome]